MNHRKVYSQGSIPFSWENSPGVSKFACQDTHIDKSSSGGKIFTPVECGLPRTTLGEELKIPPPPPYTMHLPRRTTSAKVFRWQLEDPFVVAYKECTKSAKPAKILGENRKGSQFGMRKSKSFFSCKSSCDIREDSYVRLSSLPPLPGDRTRTFRWN